MTITSSFCRRGFAVSVPSKRALFLAWLMLAETLAAAGCGGNQAATPGENGGLAGTGGKSQVGSVANTGGTAAGTLGGSFGSGKTSSATTTNPATAYGGTSFATGGASATGGVRNTGGVTASGGSSSQPTAGSSSLASGGTSTGGTKSAGGSTSTSTGGAKATGGSASTTTGGAKSTGGSTSTTTGGAKPTGGTSGTNTTVSTGGNSATGGTTASGTVPIWPKKFCGNITTSNKVDPPGLDFSRHWDQLTPENAGKWGSVQSSATAAFNWTALDTVYAYAEQHGIPFKEHTFIWGAGQPSGTYTLAVVENWIKSYCERYPKTALIDVVNEPPPHTTPTYAKVLGEGESGAWPWIVKSFKLARQHCGSAVLILNDYNNLAYADSQTHYIDIVNDVLANGGPIDALGIQAHDATKLTASQLQASLDALNSKTGLPIYISEYDIGLASDADQLAAFQTHFPLFWNSPYVRGVTVWGWMMGYTWISNSGLVNGTTPRPAMTWLMDYLGRPNVP